MQKPRALLPLLIACCILPAIAAAQQLILLDTFEDGLAPWEAVEGTAETVTEPVFDGRQALKLNGTPTGAIQRPVEFTVTEDTYITCAARDLGAYYLAVQDTDGEWYASYQATRSGWAPTYARLIGPRRSMHFDKLKPGTQIQALKIYLYVRRDPPPSPRSGYLDNIAVLEVSKARHLSELLPKPDQGPPVPVPIEFEMPEVQHPFLNLGGPEGLKNARKACAEKPTAAAQKYLDQADAFIQRWQGKELSLPWGSPNKTTHTNCPIHIIALTFDPDRPKWHYCPNCDKNYEGTIYDNGWVYNASSKMAADLSACSYAWAYTGEDKYAAQAAAILEFFADSYYDKIRPISYGDYSDAMWNSGTIHRQFINALDIIWDWSGWSADRRTSIVDRYLAPRTPPSRKEGVSNYGGRSAYEAYRFGMTIGRKEMVDDALNGTMGRYIHDLFNADGIWNEKTFGYQNFVFNYFMVLGDMAKRDLSIDLWNHDFGNKSMKTILESYAKTAMPDLRVPAIGDNRAREKGISVTAKLRKAREIYGDDIFAIYEDDAPAQPSIALRDTGWAILRSEAERFADQTYLMAVFHKHFGAHGHPDGLSFLMFANGEYLIPDLDTPDYNMKGYWTYYKNVSSHNTIVVDTNSAAPEPSKRYPRPGKLITFEDGPVKIASIADTDGDIRFRRTFVLSADGKTVIDLYQVEADAEHTYDWLFHAIGERTTPLPLAATDQLGKGWRNGYTEHTAATMAETDEPWEMTWQTEQQRLKLWMSGGPRTQVFAAKGLGWMPTETIDCAIARRRAKSTAFVAVYQALLPADEAQAITWSPDAGAIKVGALELAWLDISSPVTVNTP